jgi:ABC-2 type transport system ATP-binding protein
MQELRLPGDDQVHQGSPVIQLHNVSKQFGPVQALNDLSFTIFEGEVAAVLGPNGAGKTTAISMMLGLGVPTSGRSTLLGLDPRDSHARSRCGVMLQESGVAPNLTVRELVALFRSYYPAPLPAAQVLAMAGLESKARARAGTLSTGQRQRLYFALAICGDPDVIFLDEPTAAMDVETRRAFWAQLRSFASAGKTIVLTTHYLEEADALAGRVIVIDHGHLIADASPAVLKARIAGKRVSFDTAQPVGESALEGLPIRRLELAGQRATFMTDEPENVLKALFQRGVPLSNLEVAGIGLEEAVLTLTSN